MILSNYTYPITINNDNELLSLLILATKNIGKDKLEYLCKKLNDSNNPIEFYSCILDKDLQDYTLYSRFFNITLNRDIELFTDIINKFDINTISQFYLNKIDYRWLKYLSTIDTNDRQRINECNERIRIVLNMMNKLNISVLPKFMTPDSYDEDRINFISNELDIHIININYGIYDIEKINRTRIFLYSLVINEAYSLDQIKFIIHLMERPKHRIRLDLAMRLWYLMTIDEMKEYVINAIVNEGYKTTSISDNYEDDWLSNIDNN